MLTPSRYVLTVPLPEGEYLFVNTLSGAMIKGTEEVRSILERGPANNFDQRVVLSLLSSGFLTEMTPKEETEAALRKVASLDAAREYTLFALVLTYKCNMRCSYCFQFYVFGRDEAWLNQRMSPRQVDAAFETMETLNPETKTPVHLFGGEPLMYSHYDVVKYTLEKGTSLGKSFTIVTNGLEADTFIPLLTENNVTSLQISLDGVESVHNKRKKTIDQKGSFCKIVSSIDSLVEAGIRVFIRVVIDHSTVKMLPLFADFMKEKGWVTPKVTAYLTPARHHTAGGCFNFLCNLQEEDLEFLAACECLEGEFWRGLKSLREKVGFIEGWTPKSTYCRHLPAQLWFDPFGDLYFCTDSLGDKEHAVGTYYPAFRYTEQYLQWKKRSIYEMKSCRHCKYALICGGGCAHYAYHTKGSLLEPDCTFSRQAVTSYYPLLWKMIQKFRMKNKKR